jgi:NitT/TauT family transport system substrate-binding protein
MAVPLISEAYGAALMAKELGELEKENIELSITTMATSDTVVLLSQGKLDLTPTGWLAGILNAINGGADIKSIAPLVRFPEAGKAGLWVAKKYAKADGTVDPCVLKGKTVSFGGSAGLGSTASWWINEYFKKCPTGLTVKDVTVSNLGAGDLVAALQSGGVDGGFLVDPFWADAEAKGYAVLATPNYKGTLGGYFIGSSLSNKPEVQDAFVRALLRTTRTYLQGDYRKDPKVRPALLKVMGVPEATLDAAPPLIFDPQMTLDLSSIQGVQTTWLAIGGLLTYSTALPNEKVWDGKPIARVLAE